MVGGRVRMKVGARPPGSGPPLLIVSVLFFVSGATALSAEVVLNKLLTYVFGASHLATSTVLAAYMAGLSAGAWLFGRLTSRVARPVLAYAALELAVGGFYAILPLVFGPFQRLSIALQSPLAGAPTLLALTRFILSFSIVFAPTLMMGGTLPTLVSAFERGTALARGLPLLYAANTLGAAAGTLLASYGAIPKLGLDGTLFGCAALNLVVAAAALVVARLLPPRGSTEPTADDEAEGAGDHLAPRAVYLLAFAQGALTFSLEVVWSHLIGTVIGVTSYAFALMLSSILLGIGAGSLLLPRVAKGRPPALMFAWSMLLLAFGVAASLRGWDSFGVIVEKTPSLAAAGRFWPREAVRLGFCLVLLFPPALAMGLSLPSLAASARAGNLGRWVGRVFAANTLGTIAGSLFCGFVLLGRVRSDRILELAVVAAVALGLAGVGPALRAQRIAIGVGAVATLALALGFRGFDPDRLTQGAHYYWIDTREEGEHVDVMREDAQSGFITVTRSANGLKTLKTNGKYEGTNAAGEFQDLFALFGALYIKGWDRAALVGIGPARTLHVLYEMPFRHIEAIEHSPAMLEAAYREFEGFARAPFDDAQRVSVLCDDGRNHLQLSRQRYDYVAVAITGAAFAGSSNVYSRDFFRAVASHLTERGVFMLWIQIHHVFPGDVRSVVYTLRSVFPHVHMYTDEGQSQGFLLASLSELSVDAGLVEEGLSSPFLRTTMGQHGLASALELTERSVFTTDSELTRYFADEELGEPPVLLTDLRPAFEYATPFALASDVSSYDFQPRSDKRLPRFDPPLPREDELAYEARRFIAAHDYERAVELLEEARLTTGTTRWDAQIAWVEDLLLEAR